MSDLIEKHGGLWLSSHGSYLGTTVYELYDEISDRLVMVFLRRDGNYNGLAFSKVKDKQWAMPFWSECTPKSLYPDRESAIAYVNELLD